MIAIDAEKINPSLNQIVENEGIQYSLKVPLIIFGVVLIGR